MKFKAVMILLVLMIICVIISVNSNPNKEVDNNEINENQINDNEINDNEINIGVLLPYDLVSGELNHEALKTCLERDYFFNFEFMEDVKYKLIPIIINPYDDLEYPDNLNILFSINSLKWVDDYNDLPNSGILNLLNSNYNLIDLTSYLAVSKEKDKINNKFFSVLKETLGGELLFFPTMILPDTNYNSLGVYNEKGQLVSSVIDLEQFYNDTYYFEKRGGKANGRFDSKDEVTITLRDNKMFYSSYFKQTVYVFDNFKQVEDAYKFIDMVLSSERLIKFYESELPKHGNFIQNFIPVIEITDLEDKFKLVLRKNVFYDINSLYKTPEVYITHFSGKENIKFTKPIKEKGGVDE